MPNYLCKNYRNNGRLFIAMPMDYADFKSMFLSNFSKDLHTYFMSEDDWYHIFTKIVSHSDNRATTQFYDRLQRCKLPSNAYFNCQGGVVCSNFESNGFQKPFEDLAYYLRPWRKGPFQLGDLLIDSEWQSQLKWDRLVSTLDFLDKTVLDVGCGNGYYLYRLLEQRARFILGLDPHLLYWYQFLFIDTFMPYNSISFLPIGWQMSQRLKPVFDYVLCLGVLYHQKDPLDLLKVLKLLVKDRGELVLETLILNGDDDDVLRPKDRYACMRNVSFIPTLSVLKQWLFNVGFSVFQVLDITKTTTNEQRSTIWSSEYSLVNFLHSEDSTKTVEGYPAPIRAMVKVS